MLFSENPALWQERATTTKLATAMGNGRFRVEGILPGRYLALALAAEQGLFANATPALFEALAKHATPVVLQENEQKVLDLRLASLR